MQERVSNFVEAFSVKLSSRGRQTGRLDSNGALTAVLANRIEDRIPLCEGETSERRVSLDFRARASGSIAHDKVTTVYPKV